MRRCAARAGTARRRRAVRPRLVDESPLRPNRRPRPRRRAASSGRSAATGRTRPSPRRKTLRLRVAVEPCVEAEAWQARAPAARRRPYAHLRMLRSPPRPRPPPVVSSRVERVKLPQSCANCVIGLPGRAITAAARAPSVHGLRRKPHCTPDSFVRQPRASFATWSFVFRKLYGSRAFRSVI